MNIDFTILNNDLLGNYVAISPITVNFSDTVQANSLTALIINDNLMDSAVIRYNLYCLNTTYEPQSYSAQLMQTGTVVVSGTNYTDWNGNNRYVYAFVATQIPINLL